MYADMYTASLTQLMVNDVAIHSDSKMFKAKEVKVLRLVESRALF